MSAAAARAAVYAAAAEMGRLSHTVALPLTPAQIESARARIAEVSLALVEADLALRQTRPDLPHLPGAIADHARRRELDRLLAAGIAARFSYVQSR